MNMRSILSMSIVGMALTLQPAVAGTLYHTDPASEVGATTAVLNGKALSTVGLSGETFQYGETIGYGMTAQARPGGVNGPVSADIHGLTCGTTYHFRLIGTPGTSRSTKQGEDMTFTTLACPRTYEDIDAGPIYSNRAAQGICPPVCEAADGTWSGQWQTISGQSTSVCGCWIE